MEFVNEYGIQSNPFIAFHYAHARFQHKIYHLDIALELKTPNTIFATTIKEVGKTIA